jgi:hypothetical protein
MTPAACCPVTVGVGCSDWRNRADDPEYIVRVVGQVVRVSVEAVGIVKGLPEEFGAGK